MSSAPTGLPPSSISSSDAMTDLPPTPGLHPDDGRVTQSRAGHAAEIRPARSERLTPVAESPLDDVERGMPAGGVLVGGVVGLILALLLNAEALLRDAEQQPFGTGRDISVAVWGPVERAASALRQIGRAHV